jgi:hypothetical protein
MLDYRKKGTIMTRLCGLGLLVGMAAKLSAVVIEFKVIDLGQNLFQYRYSVSGIAFKADQELDIRFNPALFGTLSNGVAGNNFNLLLLEPNNPPGAFGDYRALALANNPSAAGSFSVDFTFLGTGAPGSQAFLINEYTASGLFISTIDSGVTTPLEQVGTPEPPTVALACVALLLSGMLRIAVAGRRHGLAIPWKPRQPRSSREAKSGESSRSLARVDAREANRVI